LNADPLITMENAMRILIAIDGSPIAMRAARRAGRLALALKDTPLLTLLHVDAPLVRAAAVKLGERNVAKYHEENSSFAMRGARHALKRLGVEFNTQCLIGDAAQRIVEVAVKGRYDLVAMGSHGHGAFTNLFIGSVVTRVLALSRVPILVVR
jgi:nucleotide-binding universal stress UspA family protein